MTAPPGERARGLVRARDAGSLSTAMAEGGAPYGSVMPYAADHQGRPLFLTADLAVHTKNLLADPACCLLAAAAASGSVQMAGRVALMGVAEQVEEPLARERYFRLFPSHRRYLEQHSFLLWRLKLDRARFIAGFGDIHWLEGSDILLGGTDWDAAEEGAVSHLNSDHADALCRILASAGAPPDARLAALDPEGMDFLLGEERTRVLFPECARTAEQLRGQVIALASK